MMKLTHKGFTLVELLIAMVLSGVLAIILYGLFDTTSESLGEVTNLTDAQDRARFALERIRADVKAAGSLATPDSAHDLWQRPKSTTGRVLGIAPYDGWQDDKTVLTPGQSSANPNVSYDGFVVMAALDFPVSFEVRGITDATDTNAVIAGHTRGLFKLYQIDPFKFDPSEPPSYPNDESFLSAQFSTRMLRLMDRQGYIQFVPLDSHTKLSYDPSSTPETLTFSFAASPVFKAPGEEYGIDPNPEGDYGYDSAFIDAYWYHVERDPTDETNLRLVRERLCASGVVAELWDPVAFKPADMTADKCVDGGAERTVIVDHVADFQIWFECGDPTTGEIKGNSQWTDEWQVLGGGECMDLGGTFEPELVRVAHIRLSLYTPNERKDLRNFEFENSLGEMGATALATTPNVRLKTFDPVPTLEGAAAVTTVQTSVELTNYGFRNPRP